MTDITRLLASLKRRSSRVKDFGDDITFVKLEDLDALVATIEKSKEESGCPAGVDLQDWVKQLAEENLTMKDAIECHKAGFTVCEACGEENGSWNDDVCKALDEIPTTDRIVAGIKADGVEMFIASLPSYADTEVDTYDDGVKAAIETTQTVYGPVFIKQLREGADK